MKASIVRQVARAQKLHAKDRPVHTFFRNPGETNETVQARVRAKIARGDARPDDKFAVFFWQPYDDEG